jgi:hypothetical protein
VQTCQKRGDMICRVGKNFIDKEFLVLFEVLWRCGDVKICRNFFLRHENFNNAFQVLKTCLFFNTQNRVPRWVFKIPGTLDKFLTKFREIHGIPGNLGTLF